MNNTPTPRTDTEHAQFPMGGYTLDFARQLERELTAAREELKAVTEQRDGIDSTYHKVIKEVLECDPIPACKREDDQLEPPWEVITRIREQRDRLTKAIEPLKYWRDISECDCSNPLPQGGCLRCDLDKILNPNQPTEP